MATSTPDNSLQQQQAAQQAQQMRQATKQAHSSNPPAVQFSQVMQTQQAAKSPTTIALLQKQNPVAGAEVVKAAVASNGGAKSKLSTVGNTQAPNTSTTTSTNTGSSDAVIGAAGGSSTSTSGSAQLLQATQQLQEMNQEFNLQYLNLQENQQSESRQYTALSNVSKTKSDTAKNSLTNVK